MLLVCLSCAVANAQEQVEVTLNDGSLVKGTTKTLFSLDNANQISVKVDGSGEKASYKSTEVKSLRLYDAKEKTWYKFESHKAQRTLPSVWVKNPKPYSEPVFLQVLYEGKHVSAYAHRISTQTNTKNLQLTGGGDMLYFKLKDEEVARAFWMSASVGWRLEMKLVFKDFPVMKPIIKDLDSKSFYDDPVSLIRKFDELLK